MFIIQRDVVPALINFVKRSNALQFHCMSIDPNLNHHPEIRILQQDHDGVFPLDHMHYFSNILDN